MKPILFNTEMVRAIQNTQKTVTRRIVKPKYTNTKIILENGKAFETVGTPVTTTEIKFPYEVGDILYVRETWAYIKSMSPTINKLVGGGVYVYRADGGIENRMGDNFWRPSIHMPKEAARIFLRIINVRVERLQDIENNNKEAKREGFDWQYIDDDFSVKIPPRVNFAACWDDNFKKSDIDKYGWNADPWVWVIEFERISKEEAYGKENRA